MDPARMYHQYNLIPGPMPSATNYLDSRLLQKSPFRFFTNGLSTSAVNATTGSQMSKTTEDERMIMLERFRAEGLDARKLSDAQKLPFVWRWMVDAEINCQSLRHQIEKMRIQHDEELQEVEDYVEQVWKLSTERLILLEDENKCLREEAAANTAAASVALKSVQQQQKKKRFSSTTTDNNNHDDNGADADGEEDAEDSDIELEKCLYGGKTIYNTNGGSGSATTKASALIKAIQLNGNGNGRLKLTSEGQHASYRSHMVSSSSTSSLASSVSMNNGLNLCDSLKLRPSRSCWQLNGNVHHPHQQPNGSELPTPTSTTETTIARDGGKTPVNQQESYCEKCEILDAELLEMRQKCAELEAQLEDLNEKNFVLEKLNRSIEMENENFAFKLAESEDRSHQLERRIFQLEKECRLNHSLRNAHTSKLVNHSHHMQLDQPTARLLIDELNHKVKSLEEALDHRLQLYEELEMKYEKQKAKQHETLWKLRNFMQDKDANMNSAGNGGTRETNSDPTSVITMTTIPLDDLFYDKNGGLSAPTTISPPSLTSTGDSGMLTMEPLGNGNSPCMPRYGSHRTRAHSVHKLV